MIVLPIPPRLNATYKTTRNGGFYKSTEAKNWETEALWEIKRQCRSIQTLKNDINVRLDYYFKRDRDIDSSIKITLDALQTARVIDNDMNIVHLDVKKHIDKIRPRVEIEIY